MYATVEYNRVYIIVYIFFCIISANLFWYGHTFFVVYTIPHIQCKIPSSVPPVFSTCKLIQFCPFCSPAFALLCFCSSAVFCVSCMGRVSYLLPPNIWVDVPSLPTYCLKSKNSGFWYIHSYTTQHQDQKCWNTHPALSSHCWNTHQALSSSHFTKDDRGILYPLGIRRGILNPLRAKLYPRTGFTSEPCTGVQYSPGNSVWGYNNSGIPDSPWLFNTAYIWEKITFTSTQTACAQLLGSVLYGNQQS